MKNTENWLLSNKLLLAASNTTISTKYVTDVLHSTVRVERADSKFFKTEGIRLV